MFKLFCVCAILAVVTAFPGGIDEPVTQDTIVKRETLTAPNVAAENNDPNAPTVETQEDMDKAETFGFGYRKYIHVYPSYYPRYYYGSYYYPRYYYGHYGHYW